jgi:ribonuclease PH
MQRLNNRQPNQLRDVKFIRNFTNQTAGSVLACFGNTKVICTATVEKGVPRFLQDKNSGWLTAEYSMLPGATNSRNRREVKSGKQSGRTCEIQRLIGRSLRAAINLKLLGEHSITIDCDVIQADGGTRVASISGAMVALTDAINHMLENKMITQNPIQQNIAAVSVGIFQGSPILDLNYIEDSQCDTDMNIVMTEDNKFIEIQGTAEHNSFDHEELNAMLELAKHGIQEIIGVQKNCLEKAEVSCDN